MNSELDFQRSLIHAFTNCDWYAEAIKATGKNGRPDLNVRHFPYAMDVECKWMRPKDLNKPFGQMFQPGQLSTMLDWIAKGSGEIFIAVAVNWEDGRGIEFFSSGVDSEKVILEMMRMRGYDLIKGPGFKSVKELAENLIYYTLNYVQGVPSEQS